MASEGVIFENVQGWDHISISDELFEKKYHDLILNFRREVQDLKDDYNAYLSFTSQSSQAKVKNEENKFESNIKIIDKTNDHIANRKQEIEKLSGSNAKLKKSCDELNERLIDLEKEGKQLLEQKNEFANEIKGTYNAFLMAKGFYKNCLKMHYTMDTDPINPHETILNIQFFTSKKTTDTKYSLKLRLNVTDHNVTLVSTNPKLPVFEELNRRLVESGDYSGFICCIRKCFVIIHSNDNTCKK